MAKSSPSLFNKTTDYYRKSLSFLQKQDPLLKTLLALHPFGKSPISKQIKSPLLNFNANDLNENTQTLFIFGIGNENSNLIIEKWLLSQPGKHVLFFEPELSVIRSFLSSQIGCALIENQQVDLLYLQTPKMWNYYKKRIYPYLATSFQILNLTKKNKAFESFKSKMIQMSIEQNTKYSEYLNTSPLIYKNFFNNLKKIKEYVLSQNLYQQFSNIPAIICGAGPSLDQEAHKIKDLQNKALIFAGGSSLSILSHHQVEPHFAVGIDPFDSHQRTIAHNTFFEIPIFFRARMHHLALDFCHGPKLYTCQAIGYPIVEHIEQKLGIFSPLIEEGHNVVNFSTQLAYLLGCNPIIFVGCDLAYSHQSPYASSLPNNQTLPSYNLIDEKDFTINRGMIKTSHDNQEVFTLWKWEQEAQWISEFSRRHKDRTFINTSLSGLKMQALETHSLQELSDSYLQNDYDLKGWIHQQINSCQSVNLELQKIQVTLLNQQEDLRTCANLLTAILQSIQSGQIVNTTILEQDLKSQDFYKHTLENLEELFEKVEQEKNLDLRKHKRYSFLLEKVEDYLKAILI